MSLIFSNFATSTLAAPINAVTTSISVQTADAAKFPQPGVGDWFPVVVANNAGVREIMKCTARASAVLTVERAKEGTTAQSFSAGDRVDMRLTKAVMLALQAMSDIPDVAAVLANLDLDLVDNTPDTLKPVSTAQQAAIDLLESDLTAYINAADAALAAASLARLPPGAMIDWPMPEPPAGYLERDGSSLSRSTYASLWAALKKQATVTISIASPGVVTWANHGRQAGDKVRFYTTGALPTGLTPNTDYFVLSAGLTSGSFRVATTSGGTQINTTGSQSGVHTGVYAPYGHGDGSTTFTLPDDRGNFPRYWDHGRGTGDTGRIFGSEQTDQVLQHDHNFTGTPVPDHGHAARYSAQDGAQADGSGGIMLKNQNQANYSAFTGTPTATRGEAIGGGGAHTPAGSISQTGGSENRVRNRAVLPIIKYN